MDLEIRSGDWCHWCRPIDSWPSLASPHLRLPPAQRLQSFRCTVLLALSLARELDPHRLEHLRQRDFFATVHELCDSVVPWVFLVSRPLLVLCVRDEVRFVEPPLFAALESNGRFGPQPIAVTLQRLEVDRAHAHWPEPSATRLVLQVHVGVRGACEDALPASILSPAAIGRPESVCRAADEGFDARHLGPPKRVEFGNLD